VTACRDYVRGHLTGRSAIVTGGNSGIGAAIAHALAEAGASVLIAGRDARRLDAVAASIRRVGGRCETVALDLRHDESAKSLIACALTHFGAINVVVHSAGVYLRGAIEDTPPEAFDAHWHVNVRAPFLITRAALPYLHEGDSILFVSSIMGHVGGSLDAAYCATKGGVELLSKALAIELAPRGIRVNCIAPGPVESPMNEEFRKDPSYTRELITKIPLARLGQPVEVAPMAVFLASSAASFISGASILIDGGVTAK
jgi:NAD(P)-dependent dehydrogenase (short-subunit alcohol dehydrogenase family)